MRIRETWRGFAKIREILGEDSRGLMRLWERIGKTLGENWQGLARVWERIHGDLLDLGEDS